MRVVLADGSRGTPSTHEPTRRALVRFAWGSVLSLCVLATAVVVLADRAAQREGIGDARRITEVVAHTVVEPRLTGEVMRGDPQALAELDQLVREHVLGGTSILRVKLWTATGRILYSDEPRLVGATYPLDAHERDVLLDGGVDADVSTVDEQENRFERDVGPRLLETYLGVRSLDGEPLLFEAYYSYDVVSARRDDLLASFGSITLLGLAVLAAVQLWLAWTGSRWARDQRLRLVDEAAAGSRRERLRLASDLHDGTLQDLVGASYVVAGAVEPVRRLGGADVAEGLGAAVDGIRTGVQSLRSMIVDIYPESLRTAGLHAALSDLVAPLRARGVDVRISAPDDPGLPQELEEAVYRAAQEALRNTAAHARAGNVDVEVTATEQEVALVVRDDGVGFDATSGLPPGHLGLRGLADRTAARGGRLAVVTAPGEGTELRLELPR